MLCESLPLDKPLRIYAVKDGFDSVNSELTVPPGEAPQVTELLMKRTPYGGDVLVRVVDMDGKPIEGAELFNQGNSSRNLRTAKTNADGEALIQNVFKSFTGVVIVAKAADYVAQEIPATPGPIDLPGTVKITMRRGNTLRGQVVDPAGKPMPKLLVYFDRGENGDLKGGRVTTDGNGRFEISGLGAKAMLTVYAPQEYAPIQHMVVSTELNEEVELKLEPTGLLRIRAIDEESKQAIPAFNVRVGFCEQRQAGDLSPRSLISSLMVDGVNIQGDVREYRLGNQAPGTALKVIVSAKGYQSITIPRMISVSSEQAECVDVALAKEDMRDYQVVAGRILDANGKPIVGAVVRLVNGSVVPTPQVAGLPPTEVGWKSYSWDSLKRDDIESRDQCKQLLKTVSDKEGCFRFEKVLQFTPWLELYYTGDRLLPQRFSNLRDKKAAELQELELVAERPCQLKVKVDKDKFPQAVKIRLAAADGGVNSIKLAYSYEYQELAEMNAFSNLPSGTYNVSLMAKTIPLGGGAFTNETLTTEPITLEPGSELEVAFE